ERPTGLVGRVTYRGVVFGYEDGRPVLSEVALQAQTGARIALVGLSASGKPAMVKTLPRFCPSSAASGAERVREFLDRPVESRMGRNTYRGVLVGYEQGHPVLNELELDIRANGRVARLGWAGSHGTTAVTLRPPFH